MQKAKWLSGEAVQIAKKRRKAKGKGEKERYSFECKVPRRDRKASLRDQCKEVEESIRIAKDITERLN